MQQKTVSHPVGAPDFEFPSIALAEMSTSDDVADVHSSMVKAGDRILDMTAGLGIDALHFAKKDAM